MAINPVNVVRMQRRFLTTATIAVVLAALIGWGACGGSGEDSWIREADDAVKEQGDLGLLGGKPSDADIRKACRVLQKNDWDYDDALEDAAMSFQLTMIRHLDAIQTVLDDDVTDYCAAKLY